jgi:hypothetical protein
VKRAGAFARVILLVAATFGSTGCASMWTDWFADVEMPEWPAFDEYTESPKSYVEIALEHDFLVRVKPWEPAGGSASRLPPPGGRRPPPLQIPK